MWLVRRLEMVCTVLSSWELIVACSKQRNVSQGRLAFHGSTVLGASWLFSNSRVRGSQLLQILFVIKKKTTHRKHWFIFQKYWILNIKSQSLSIKLETITSKQEKLHSRIFWPTHLPIDQCPIGKEKNKNKNLYIIEILLQIKLHSHC